jgi:integrase
MKVRKRTWKDANGKRRSAWVMDYVEDGIRRRQTLKVEDRKDAELLASQLWVDIQKRSVLGDDAPASELQKALNVEMLLSWHSSRPGISDATRALEKRNAKPLIRILNGRTLVHTINSAKLDAYKKQRHDQEKKAPRTVNMELALLSAAMNHGREAGKVHRVPTFKRLPEQKQHRDVLTRQQIQAILSECHELGIYDHVTVQANFGLRIGELFRIRWEDVDLQARDGFPLGSLRMKNNKHGGTGNVVFRLLPLNQATHEVFLRRLGRGTSGTRACVRHRTGEAKRPARAQAPRARRPGERRRVPDGLPVQG